MDFAHGFSLHPWRRSLKRKPEGDLQRVEFLWPRDVVTAVEQYGLGQDLDRTAAALALVRRSLDEDALDDALIAWKGSGAQAQLEGVLSHLESLEDLTRRVAITTFGLDELLRDWMLRTGVLRVTEEELLNEVRRVSWDAFECLMDALEHGRRSPWDGCFPTRGEGA